MKTIRQGWRSIIWLKDQKTYRVVLILGSVALAVLLVVTFSILLAQDISASDVFPAGTRIAGVDVGGLTKAEALDKCKTGLVEIANRPLTLKIDDEAYKVTPGEIGLEFKYDEMVEEAYSRAWNVNVFERMIRRFLKKPKNIDCPAIVKYDEKAVASFVKGAMDSINRPPSNAYIDISTGVGRIAPAKEGRTAEYEQVLAEAKKALGTAKRTVNVQAARTPAENNGEGFGKYILVNLGSHTLSLYNRDTLIASYPVACGSSEWPTAIGQWAVVKKEKNPTWYNRGSTWMNNMPPSIPPGPGNPLGTRAITINGGGVLIHGTTDSWSIGRSVSHGCIRMYMGHVEELFDQVEINMPVYIIKESGNPGFDCSKKPFWQ